MALELFFVSARTNKRHHHHHDPGVQAQDSRVLLAQSHRRTSSSYCTVCTQLTVRRLRERAGIALFSQRLKRGPLGPCPPPSCAFWHPATDHTRQRSPTCQQGVVAHVSCVQIYRRSIASRDESAGEPRGSDLPALCLSSSSGASGALLSRRPPPQPAPWQASARAGLRQPSPRGQQHAFSPPLPGPPPPQPAAQNQRSRNPSAARA